MRLMEPPGGRPWALLGLCGASLLLNVVLVVKLTGSDPAEPAAQAAVAPTPEPVAVVEAPAMVAADVATVEPPAREVVPENVRVVQANVEHSMARTFQRALPATKADVVSAVYARLFVWDLDVRRDLQRGDKVRAAFEWDGELAEIPVASYRSQKLGRTLRAYRFQATGDAYPSWWDEQGRETSLRLVNGPLRDYEQVTSLLKDRPNHRGMDFKVPVGAEVLAPRGGRVVRTNWNVGFNGNCIELQLDDGTLARFLHLSQVDVQPGQRISQGQVVGLTGNTGRSTGPHLHYELERNGRIVDPVDYHQTVRRTLPQADLSAFEAERQRLDALLAQAEG